MLPTSYDLGMCRDVLTDAIMTMITTDLLAAPLNLSNTWVIKYSIAQRLSYPVAGGVVTPIHTVPRPVTIHKTTCDCVTTLLNCQWPCNCGKNLPWPRLYCRTRRNMVSHTHPHLHPPVYGVTVLVTDIGVAPRWIGSSTQAWWGTICMTSFIIWFVPPVEIDYSFQALW